MFELKQLLLLLQKNENYRDTGLRLSVAYSKISQEPAGGCYLLSALIWILVFIVFKECSLV